MFHCICKQFTNTSQLFLKRFLIGIDNIKGTIHPKNECSVIYSPSRRFAQTMNVSGVQIKELIGHFSKCLCVVFLGFFSWLSVCKGSFFSSIWSDVFSGAGRRGGGRSSPLPFRIPPVQRWPVCRWVGRAPAVWGGRHKISYNLTSVPLTFYKAQEVAVRQQWSQKHRDSKGTWDASLFFPLFVPYTHWTELSLAPLCGVRVVLIYQYLFLTSLPRWWLLFSHNDRFSSKWCSNLPKFRRKQSCPTHRKIRLKMATRWVTCYSDTYIYFLYNYFFF